jgi:hypothetical protein
MTEQVGALAVLTLRSATDADEVAADGISVDGVAQLGRESE